jgi:hypothetical protein
LLDGTYVLRDVDGAQGMRDLDVVLDGGGYVAVEVTGLMNGPYRAFIGAKITRPAPSLSGTWVVHIDHQQDFRPFWKRAEQLFAGVEALGWDGIDLSPGRAEPVPVVELRGLGVQQAALVRGTEGGIGLTDPNFNTIGPVDVSNGVAERLAQEDNRLKLGAAADAVERHLFVWAEMLHLAGAAMDVSTLLPDDRPELPEEVDVVWVARELWVRPLDADRLWRYDASGWSDETARLPHGHVGW